MNKLKKLNWKYMFVVVGYTQAVGMTITMFIIFITAYLNGFKTIVLINHYGEAHVELVFFMIVSVFIFGGCFFVLRDLYYEKNVDE